MTMDEFMNFINQKPLKSFDFKEELSLMNDQQVGHLEEEFKDFNKQFSKE